MFKLINIDAHRFAAVSPKVQLSKCMSSLVRWLLCRNRATGAGSHVGSFWRAQPELIVQPEQIAENYLGACGGYRHLWEDLLNSAVPGAKHTGKGWCKQE